MEKAALAASDLTRFLIDLGTRPAADLGFAARLATILRTVEAECDTKYEILMKQKAEIEKAARAKEEKTAKAAALNEEMIETLKKELEQVRAQASGDINNVARQI